MGEEGGHAASPLSLREAFEKACPVYMSYGMSYEDFWHGDVRAHRMYREAHKQIVTEQNLMSWLTGRYVYDALCAVAPILSMRSKATKPNDYLKNPYDLFEEDRIRREENERKKRYEHIKAKVAAFAKAHNEKNQRKEVYNAGS